MVCGPARCMMYKCVLRLSIFDSSNSEKIDFLTSEISFDSSPYLDVYSISDNSNTDTRLIIELSTQVSTLNAEIEYLQERLMKYEQES